MEKENPLNRSLPNGDGRKTEISDRYPFKEKLGEGDDRKEMKRSKKEC